MSEKPRSHRPRRLAEWLNPTGAKKVHSLVDKVYKLKNLEMAWERVRKNKGAGGVDGVSIEVFKEDLIGNLRRLHIDLSQDTYRPKPVLQKLIPKSGQPGKTRPLGIPTIYDRVCQQALVNRLEPIFEPMFDDASFGYRRGRSQKDALRKIWSEIMAGEEWIVDADLKNFFGSIHHEKLMSLVNQRVSDGRVLSLIQSMLTAGFVDSGKKFPSEQGVPQGGVISPLMSNILLTPFDREMREAGHKLTRWADDWVVTSGTREEAIAALQRARGILERLGVKLHSGKTRIVNVRQGFEFLGFKIKRGSRPLRLTADKIKTGVKHGDLYAFPRAKSTEHFQDQIRKATRRRAPVSTETLIEQINPIIRGWGNYYRKAHIRKHFAALDRWILHRIWSHRFKRWRGRWYRKLPEAVLYEQFKLVRLVALIPSLASRFE